jgi:hypothetical protein
MNTILIGKGNGKRRGSVRGNGKAGANERSGLRVRGGGASELQVAEIDRTFTARWEY